MRRRDLPLALLFLSVAACGGDDDEKACTGSNDSEELQGSYCEGSEIAYDAIELGWLPSGQALRIRYGVTEGDRVSPRFEIQLLGERVRLEPNVRFPLREVGFVRRWPEGASDPQNLTDRLMPSSGIVFDRLELRAGGPASGRFDMLFDTGRTLRGAFEGALRDLTP